MKKADVSFLRKQESRLVPAEAGTQACSRGSGNPGNMEFSYVLDSRLRGNDTPGLACRRRDQLLHSAKVLPFG